VDSAGELFGAVGVFAAFLMRERVPEGRDGFVGFVVGDFTWRRSLVRASSWSSASNAMSAACATRYPFSSTLIQSTAAMPGSAGEKGPGGGWHQCGTVLGYSGIQIGLGSTELDSGPHRPAPGCLVNRYNRVVLYVTM